ncbi:conjugal transfer protein TraK [Allomuricauda sp. NBRC 101325]|uniref:conjugal transfer protein TraK n=1 Tax=Allomuricauda sp. NBRC 101325 TaxID=1113758 RepID=UPI002556F8C3|nr:conjugal transfer protein TraK [Muricauda sp. NBRC 101325]
MKTPFKNIVQVLRLNRWVVLSVVMVSGLVSMVSIFLVAKMHRESLDHAFVVNGEGEVIPIAWEHQRQNLEVEALAHLERFHQWFYGVDAGSYENHMEKVLWLGDASVAEVYQQKKADGFYNRLLQYSLVQQVERIDSKIVIGKEYLEFQTLTLVQIRRGSALDSYELVTSGHLIQVERNFPHNPHGLLITDFFENSLRKIQIHESTEK